MPYIKQEERKALHAGAAIQTAGQLNYVLTQIIHDYVRTLGLKYQTINDVVGALDGAKVEFQRTIVAKYEDEKRIINGDV